MQETLAETGFWLFPWAWLHGMEHWHPECLTASYTVQGQLQDLSCLVVGHVTSGCCLCAAFIEHCPWCEKSQHRELVFTSLPLKTWITMVKSAEKRQQSDQIGRTLHKEMRVYFLAYWNPYCLSCQVVWTILYSPGEYLFEVTAVTSFMMLLILFPLLYTPLYFLPYVFNCCKVFKKWINLEVFF